MKFFRIAVIAFAVIFGFNSCKKEVGKNWNIKIENPQNIELTDISAELYNPNISLESFKQKYPWFQGTIPDDVFEERRKDADEIKIYKDAAAKIDQNKLKKNLENLFSHIRYYFPEFKTPKVFLYSSALQGILNPIFYHSEDGFLFIDISAFMGENHPNYKGLELYFQKSMNPANIIPKVSEIFAEHFVEVNPDQQKFLYQLVYQGKLMILQDAFLPDEPDFLKINYTQKQYDWALANEVNIWDFFVENDLLYSDDADLTERFIAPAPFSKFYTEIDNESSPQIGIFTGWQICKKFFQEKSDTKIQDFLKMDAQELFNQARYKPEFEE
ncbi:MAG: gliding motility protein GldB [Flavobacteriaceae bacterium]|jgi:hypothetical protein|nr:gliding motility protein GldB [Flavobacteriaceae bacterium]